MLNRCHTECDCKTIDRRNQGELPCARENWIVRDVPELRILDDQLGARTDAAWRHQEQRAGSALSEKRFPDVLQSSGTIRRLR
jgi:hypothetical protein